MKREYQIQVTIFPSNQGHWNSVDEYFDLAELIETHIEKLPGCEWYYSEGSRQMGFTITIDLNKKD